MFSSYKVAPCMKLGEAPFKDLHPHPSPKKKKEKNQAFHTAFPWESIPVQECLDSLFPFSQTYLSSPITRKHVHFPLQSLCPQPCLSKHF